MMIKSSHDPSTYAAYAAGAGIGVLEWFTLTTAGRTLGVTSPFESTAAALTEMIAPESPHVSAYLEARGKEPKLDWEWMLVAGIPIGAHLAAHTSEPPRHRAVPETWSRRFGDNIALRTAGAFLGGALMMFGARMAKGCTSGHCISGNAQLSLSSWLFSAVMGATSVGITRALFGEKS